jgi:hypothetical protein
VKPPHWSTQLYREHRQSVRPRNSSKPLGPAVVLGNEATHWRGQPNRVGTRRDGNSGPCRATAATLAIRSGSTTRRPRPKTSGTGAFASAVQKSTKPRVTRSATRQKYAPVSNMYWVWSKAYGASIKYVRTGQERQACVERIGQPLRFFQLHPAFVYASCL